jgi:hypothetical protein
MAGTSPTDSPVISLDGFLGTDIYRIAPLFKGIFTMQKPVKIFPSKDSNLQKLEWKIWKKRHRTTVHILRTFIFLEVAIKLSIESIVFH